MDVRIFRNDWSSVLQNEFEKAYYQELKQSLAEEYRTNTIYPEMGDIFNAFHLTPYSEAKVLILGQDPYHGPGQAHGLSFSVKPGVKVPPSLKNIFKELQSDLGCKIPNHGCLVTWAKQGVLLLNTVLTVRQGAPNSHKDIGWEKFTDKVISCLNNREKPLVFLLWGNNAYAKEALITSPQHYIIKVPHPSPLSAHRGFFGSRPFSKINRFLEQKGLGKIDWQIHPIPNLTS